tara:strand:+ start:14657 stop:15055 length:399 start_codon:yes stop_codon:yes gene_type:complete
MSKIIAHNTLPGVMLAVMPAQVQSTVTPEATPKELTNKDGETTLYHWAKVSIKDNNGVIQNGSAIVWNKLLQANPTDYTEGKSIDIEVQLNGDGAGYAQVHLNDGKFDVANLIDAEQLKGFANLTTDGTVAQ